MGSGSAVTRNAWLWPEGRFCHDHVWQSIVSLPGPFMAMSHLAVAVVHGSLQPSVVELAA